MKGKFTLSDDEVIEAIRRYLRDEKKIESDTAVVRIVDEDDDTITEASIVVEIEEVQHL